MEDKSNAAPALVDLGEAQRRHAMTRFAVLQPYLEGETPLVSLSARIWRSDPNGRALAGALSTRWSCRVGQARPWRYRTVHPSAATAHPTNS